MSLVHQATHSKRVVELDLMRSSRPLPQISLRQSVPALSKVENESLTRAGERLAGELHALFSKLPEDSRTVRGIADYLGVDRNITQRALSAIYPFVDGLQVVLKAPGVRSLRRLVAGARSKGLDDLSIRALDEAIAVVDDLILTIAGNQSRLRQMIHSTISAEETIGVEPAISPMIVERARHFEQGARIVGTHCDVLLTLRLLRPFPGDASLIETVSVTGLIGQQAIAGGMPVFVRPPTLMRDHTLMPTGIEGIQEPHGSSLSLLERFSTTPLPTICSRGPNGREARVVEPKAMEDGRKIDVVTASRIGPSPSPLAQPRSRYNVVMRVARPTRRLLFDAYIHQNLATRSVGSLAAYIWAPGLDLDLEGNWYERLPGTPHLATLGVGTANAASEGWGRQAELTDYIFDLLKWDPNEFHGFRGDVLFPLWGAAYYMSFFFANEASSPVSGPVSSSE